LVGSEVPVALVAVNDISDLFIAVGVPVSVPVEELNDIPAGNPVTAHDVGDPVACNCVAGYAALTGEIGSARLVITGGDEPAAFTVNASDVLADPYAFVAVNVIDPLAVAVGVPDSTPALLNVMPAGSAPPVTLQVIGAVPVAVNVVVGYSVLTVPATRNAGDVMVGAVAPPPARDQAILTLTAPGMS